MQPQDTTRTIPLSKGYEAIVDAADYEWLSQYTWQAKVNAKGYVYAYTGNITNSMHRMIAGAAKRDEIVDHIDRDTLNNTRANLRIVTKQQNTLNSKLYKTNTAGYRGVTWHKGDKRWHAQLWTQDKKYHLGSFTDPEDAARAYDEAARQHFGEFAQVNFPAQN